MHFSIKHLLLAGLLFAELTASLSANATPGLASVVQSEITFRYVWTPVSALEASIVQPGRRGEIEIDRGTWQPLLGTPRPFWRFAGPVLGSAACAASVAWLAAGAFTDDLGIQGGASAVAGVLGAMGVGLWPSYPLIHGGWEQTTRVMNRWRSETDLPAPRWFRSLAFSGHLYRHREVSVREDQTGAYRLGTLLGAVFIEDAEGNLDSVEGRFSFQSRVGGTAISAEPLTTRQRLLRTRSPFTIAPHSTYYFLEDGSLYPAVVLGTASNGDVHYVYVEDQERANWARFDMPIHTAGRGDVYHFITDDDYNRRAEADLIRAQRFASTHRLPPPAERRTAVLTSCPFNERYDGSQLLRCYRRSVGLEDPSSAIREGEPPL